MAPGSQVSGDGLSLPTSLHADAGGTAPSGPSNAKDWTASFASRHRSRLSRHGSGLPAHDGPSPAHTPRWWKIRLFQGMINDVRRRAPFYWSDWADAWNYRVVPATVYMYFANILPALAFSLDMFSKTNMSYGVNEVLLASVLGSVVFAVLACQPLVIVGVTGPITVFNYTVFDIVSPTGTNYLGFMTWIGLWSLVLHWILAVTNSCNLLRYVTRFPCDIFGFYVAFIYLEKGVQVLERLGDDEPFYLSVMVSLLVFMVAYICGELGQGSLFKHPIRVFLKDYGTPLTVVFFTGFVHIGKMSDVQLQNLPTSTAFLPTAARGWLVDFWNVRVGDVFLALPFAVLLTILFWFDHNVSSLIAQGTEFPLKKPAGFHWDFFLLGLTTGVAGLLGLPFPNGLIPQAPFHTESLCVTAVVKDEDESGENKGHFSVQPTHVVEQRASNLAQGLLTLGTMTGPLLTVLHLIPQAVLAGLFFIMGLQALQANGITAKLLFLCRDAALTPRAHPLRRLPRRSAAWLFVALELAAFAATFAITQTVAAVGFPVFILALIPVRALLLPRWFAPAELALLDGPTASPFTMESAGGAYTAAGTVPAAIDAVEGTSSDENDARGKQPSDSDGRGLWADPTRPSEDGRAELGQGKVAGTATEDEISPSARGSMTRRRGSAVGRSGTGEGDGVEMHRLGVGRRG